MNRRGSRFIITQSSDLLSVPNGETNSVLIECTRFHERFKEPLIDLQRRLWAESQRLSASQHTLAPICSSGLRLSELLYLPQE